MNNSDMVDELTEEVIKPSQIFKYQPKKDFNSKYRKQRQKRNSQQKKSRRINRKK